MEQKIQAVLFDSGRVLNRPATGSWFITPNFFKYVDKDDFDRIGKVKVKKAFSKAMLYISKIRYVKDEKQEYEYFYSFYNII